MQVMPVTQEHAEPLERIAGEILKPLYGDQSKAYNEWMTGAGYKHAFVIEVDGRVGGLLSMKANPVKDYLKVSTLLVLDPCQGRGCGQAMLQFAIDFAIEYGYESIVVTVSESKPESIAFFRKHGFVVIDEQCGKYIDGVTEFVMQKEL